jgi:two-component system sensor histidine kinase PilS (NtrC family)
VIQNLRAQFVGRAARLARELTAPPAAPQDRSVGIAIAAALVVATMAAARTGGVRSPLVLLYVLTVFAAGITRGARAAIGTSVASTIAYALVGALVGDGDGVGLDAARLGTEIAYHGGAFLLVAVLTAVLVERTRRSAEVLESKDRELERIQTSTDRILQHMAIGVITASADGRIDRINAAARELLGLEPEIVLEGEDLAAFLTTISPAVAEAAESTRLTGRWAAREEILLRQGTGDRPLGISFAPLVGTDGMLDGVITTIHDLSGVRRMEVAMRRSEQLAHLGELAASVAHEIRNPLASISGAVQVLRDEVDLATDERELMDLIVRESDRLNRIIDGVLDYTRDHSGSRVVHDVSITAREVLRLLSHDQQLMLGKTFLLDFPEDRDFLAEVEEGGLKQVFLNLAKNALQAMGVGGILRVTGEAHEGRIYVTFKDTGPGIASHELEEIFKPFHTTKRGGTGLGLSIASRIVEGNGGVIRVRSTPGVGTAFTVELPAAARGGSSPGADRPKSEGTLHSVEATR